MAHSLTPAPRQQHADNAQASQSNFWMEKQNKRNEFSVEEHTSIDIIAFQSC
jgi:hypothetical protein